MGGMRDINHYQTNYMADYGFERVMVACRRRVLLERLLKIQPKIIVEVGCGSELLYEHHLKQSDMVDFWVIVEPGEKFCEMARLHNLPNLHVIQGFFEESDAMVLEILPRLPDMVICSGVLHEVPSAQVLLTSIANIMSESSTLHVNVPNADSFHRRLAVAMGIMTNLKALSNRNRQLLQHRVYDLQSLKIDLIEAGLNPVEHGGYLIKPFTHEQMELISTTLGDGVLDGLYELGKQFPQWASEIYIEARKVEL